MSSASSVKSCFEPLLVETSVSMHQMTPYKTDLSFSWPQKSSSCEQQQHKEIPHTQNFNCRNNINPDDSKCQNVKMDCWDFVQALNNSSHNRKQVQETEQVYVHPLTKRSSSALSIKSLEMCTESLGSETGSNIDEGMDEFFPFSMERPNPGGIQKTEHWKPTRKLSHTPSFPPPLTSISGSEGVQLRAHREGGRFVIKAMTFSSCTAYFQAERADGRLKLSLFQEGGSNFDIAEAENFPVEHENAINEADEEEEEEDKEEKEEEGGEEYYENNVKDSSEFEPGENDPSELYWGGKIRERNEKIGRKIGSGEWASSSSRCKRERSESKRMPSLPFCVAISS